MIAAESPGLYLLIGGICTAVFAGGAQVAVAMISKRRSASEDSVDEANADKIHIQTSAELIGLVRAEIQRCIESNEVLRISNEAMRHANEDMQTKIVNLTIRVGQLTSALRSNGVTIPPEGQ